MSKLTKKVTKEVDEIVGTKCDSCGNECGEEYMELTTAWGYVSKKDGETWSADLCENCVDKLLVPHVKFAKEDIFLGEMGD